MESRKRDKASKFIELANLRVNKAIGAVRNISKLSNKNNYTYNQKQVAQIILALKKEVSAVEAAFKSEGRDTEEFKLG